MSHKYQKRLSNIVDNDVILKKDCMINELTRLMQLILVDLF